MQGLMLKLLNVDAEGERALRVVAYFDQLTANHPDLESVVRATAILADCTAGLRAPGNPRTLRFTRDGDALPAALNGTPTSTVPLALSEFTQVEGMVWLERISDPGSLDQFILERMALTAISVIQRHAAPAEIDTTRGFSDPALADLLVNQRATAADRTRAARLMGLDPAQRIQLVSLRPATHGVPDTDALTASLRAAWRCQVHVAQMSSNLLLAIVVTRVSVDWSDVAFGGKAASGPVVEVDQAPTSWALAQLALRFAQVGTSWPAFVDSNDIGSLGLLAGLDERSVQGEPDVKAIQRLWNDPNGHESVRVLDLFLHSDSLRSAARDANLHHSSVQARLQRIETCIGMNLRSGQGRQRAAHALLLWQLFGAQE